MKIFKYFPQNILHQYFLSCIFTYSIYKIKLYWKIDGETVETEADFIFGAPKSLQMVIAVMRLKAIYSLEEKLWPT